MGRRPGRARARAPAARVFAPGMPGSAQGGFAGGGMSGQGGPGDFAAGGMGGLSAAVHADYVVLQGSQYVAMAEQTGTVSEVSSSSVTVKSSDGFTRSYALGSDVAVSNLQQRRQQAGGTASQLTVADIVAGGTVRIVAAKDGSGYTAASVMVVAADLDRLDRPVQLSHRRANIAAGPMGPAACPLRGQLGLREWGGVVWPSRNALNIFGMRHIYRRKFGKAHNLPLQ